MAKSVKITQGKYSIFHSNFFTSLQSSKSDRKQWDIVDINFRKTIESSSNFETSDVFILPVNISNKHWLLSTINKNDKKIRIFDSGSQRPYLKNVKSTLEKFLKVSISWFSYFTYI